MLTMGLKLKRCINPVTNRRQVSCQPSWEQGIKSRKDVSEPEQLGSRVATAKPFLIPMPAVRVGSFSFEQAVALCQALSTQCLAIYN